ncbi:hypothetical protein F0562_021594 [Nyssa sinensis]|uniref:Uncharacterized protein n=1 Tax=Nyssa sinensis TaxID=561372 RepID=A0A5J5BND1_9ASTE|nr:hypothetical protein F0562_021594 [Nyssa sinensis]
MRADDIGGNLLRMTKNDLTLLLRLYKLYIAGFSLKRWCKLRYQSEERKVAEERLDSGSYVGMGRHCG